MSVPAVVQILAAILLLYLLSRMLLGKVAPEKARALVQEGASLVDVRTPHEFASGHIEGARNIPLSDLPARVADLGACDVPVVVYCASGLRSASARSILRRAGFQQVYDLGGMRRWS